MLIKKRKIHALNWTRNRLPIRRSKLVHEVARKLERYLNRMAVRSYHDETDLTVAYKGHYRGFLWTNLLKIAGGSARVS